MAKRDAAFEAYVKLYHAGLINDNLLPISVPDPEAVGLSQIESRENLREVSGRLDPWQDIALDWRSTADLHALQVDICGQGDALPSLLLILPTSLSTNLNLTLYWTPAVTYTAKVQPLFEKLEDFPLDAAQQLTQYLIKTVFQRKIRAENLADAVLPYLLVPKGHLTSLHHWLEANTGQFPLETLARKENEEIESYLIWRQSHSIPYILHQNSELDREDVVNDISKDEGSITLVRLPRRIDFLHPLTSDIAHTAKEKVPNSECSVERLPSVFARAIMFIPSILHIIELSMVAQKAATTLLSPIGFRNLHLVISALAASAANEFTNYQRFEFLGDGLLKFFTSVQLFCCHPRWHEGFLSRTKDRTVNNGRLCRAAMEMGLDQFIHTEPFAGAQWKVRTNKEIIRGLEMQPKRQMSRKVLADVVEGLIGAAYLDGHSRKESEQNVIACLSLFLPELSWDTVDNNLLQITFPDLPEDVAVDHFVRLEAMIVYRFNKHILLAEALTHPSAIAIGGSMSYQRLEFLGDAVIDMIVVDALFQADTTLHPFEMHLVRTAIVNADFLAFLCLGTGIDLDRQDVATNNSTHETIITPVIETKHLHDFMITFGLEIALARQSCLERYQDLQGEIEAALKQGLKYPWSPLSRLAAPKFFSDLIESLVGAIFVDSHGSLDACRLFLGEIGLMKYLQRLIEEPTIDVMHPKERLGVVSGNSKIDYLPSKERNEDGVLRHTCRVLVDGNVLAEARDGYTRLEVETRAAEDAVSVVLEKNTTLGS